MVKCSTGSEHKPTGEDNQILTEIRISLSKLAKISNSISRENLCLKRLYFDSMHRREDSVEDPQGGSFGWMLEGPEDEDESENEEEPLVYLQQARSLYSTSSISSSDSTETDHDNDLASQGVANGLHKVHIQNCIVVTNYSSSPSAAQSDSGDEENRILDLHDTFDHDENSEESDFEVYPASDIEDILDSDSINTSSLHSPKLAKIDAEELKRRFEISKSFISFLRKDHGVFFITGKPGSGKSTLMKFLAHHQRVREELERWADPKKLVFIPTFFWNSGDTMQMSLEGFYRAILFEILKQCPDLLQDIFPSSGDQFLNGGVILTPPDEKIPFRMSELKVAFQNMTKAQCFRSYRFCFFIDGLDEYEGDSTDHIALAKSLKEMAGCEDVKVICSARPHTEFVDTFKSSPGTIYLHDLTRDDIRRFTMAQFMFILKDSRYDDTREDFLKFVDYIVDTADGVFLWARLVVRSLISGITHSDSPADLHARLEHTPKDLNGLFRKMLAGVDDAVRHRSNKMLLVAIHNPFDTPLNALAYSWLNDLGDPKFPFNQPIWFYSDEEVTKRISVVRHQIDVLTKGLLEIRETHDRREFLYSRYRVEFFHRSVKDYLKDEWNRDGSQVRHSKFDKFETYCRLKLAEARFSRSWILYRSEIGFFDSLFFIYRATFGWVEKREHDLPPNCFDEWARVIDSFQRVLPFSGGETIESTRRTDQITSYSHWALSYQIPNIVELLKHARSRNVDTEFNILLVASSTAQLDIVKCLLSNGLSPNEQVKVKVTAEMYGFHNSGFVQAPVWMVLLQLLATRRIGQMCWSRMSNHPWESSRYFLILEEYLRFGADRDVYFLGFFETGKKQADHEYYPHDEELFYLELHQFLQLFWPGRFQSIQKLLIGSVSQQVWNKTASLLGGLAPWIPSLPSIRTKYKPADLDQLRHTQWSVYGVVSKTVRLLGPVENRYY